MPVNVLSLSLSLSLTDIPQVSGCVARRPRGQRSACGHVAVSVVGLRATEKEQGTRISTPLTFHCKRVWRGDEGVSADVVFYGVMVVVGPTSDLCLVTEGKQTDALFQWEVNHDGELVAFQFIKWI